MITAPDFGKKQVVFVLFNEGEKLAFQNDNLVVRKPDGSIKFQCTCYRLFIVYAVGHCSVTSVLIQRAAKFGFFLALMTPSFRLYALLGGQKDGNTLLHRKQYAYDELGIAKHITENKISNQIRALKEMRNKSDIVLEAIDHLSKYQEQVSEAADLNTLMGYEGMSSKLYFRAFFNNTAWNGRLPRVKADIVNSTLDIAYTLLFTFVDSLLQSFGFDTYCGVMHRQFYMRKSLTCDLVEPFRPLVDAGVKRAISLKQIQEKDFILIQRQYRLRWEESARYVQFLMQPILEEKERIFSYIQSYYRCFMKECPAYSFPVYRKGGTE